MAISSKGYKPYNFESHNSLKLSFTNIRDLRSNFIDYECFLESNSSEILALCLFSVIVDFKWLWMESLHKNIHLMLEFLKAPFLVLHFSYYTLMTFLIMLLVILLSILMILRSILSGIRHLICGSSLN